MIAIVKEDKELQSDLEVGLDKQLKKNLDSLT